jgi:tetratricopeptide (TPR) repeat protein
LRSRASFEKAAPPKILIAAIAGDRAGQIGKRLGDFFAGVAGVEVFAKKDTLKLPDAAGDMAERLILAAEEGRAWLTSENCDLLIWGEAAGAGTLTLRFLPAPGNDSERTVFAGLGETVELPVAYPAELDLLVGAVAFGAFLTSFKGARAKLAVTLGTYLGSVDGLAKKLPPGLTDDQSASVLTALGNAFVAYSRLGGGPGQLDRAAFAFQAAEKLVTKETAPLTWARIQNHLATVLQAQGQIKREPKLLRNAAIIFSTITTTLDRNRHANDWALAYTYLGKVLYILAGMEGQPKYLKTAADAYEKALSVYDKETMPSRWAEVTNQYGVVLLAFGEGMGGDAVLEQAVAKFRTAMNLRQRDKTPLLWAQTANNLGAACFALAKRNLEASLLREASSCFEGATEIYRQQGIDKQARVIEKNLHRVQRLLTTRGA